MKSKPIFSAILCISLLALLTGCAKVTDVAIAPIDDTLYIGDVVQLTPELTFDKDSPSEDDTAKALAAGVWASADETVATIDGNGVLAVQAAGTTTITYSNNSCTASMELSAYAHVASIELPDEPLVINNLTKDDRRIEYTTLPEASSQDEVMFSSRDESVAVVSSDGVVSFSGAGNTIIDLTTPRGVKASIEVYAQLCAQGIATDTTEITVKEGNTDADITFTFDYGEYEAAESPTLYCWSDDDSIATIAAGIGVTGISPGSTTVHIATDSEHTVCVDIPVTVEEKPLDASTKDGRLALATQEAQRVVASIITPGMSDYEKAYAIFNYLHTNVAIQDNQSNAAYKTNYGNEAYAALIMHKAACSGFCRAVTLMCNAAGLPSQHVNAGLWTHQWNRILIDGTWTVCDAQGGIFGGTTHPLEGEPAYYDAEGRAWYAAGTDANGNPLYIAQG